MAAPSTSSNGGLQSVDRALQVLELLAGWGEGGVSEIAGALDVHKSTASRLLGALEARELVEQTEDRGKYRLGFGLVRLAGAVSGQLDLAKQARQVTEPLAARLGETVNLAVLREHFAVNVDQTLGPATVGVQNWVGKLTPLHATSSGKVLLAHVEPTARRELLGGGLDAYTPETITSRKALDKALTEVVEKGYAVAYGELEEGLNAVAVPVLGVDGTLVGALSVAGPDFRFGPAEIEAALEPLFAAGRERSRRVGYLGGPAAERG